MDSSRLLASVAAAGAVILVMLSADALTRGSLPVPSARERVHVDVRSAALLPARTPSGRRRELARFIMRVRVTNISARRLRLRQPALVVHGRRVRLDRTTRQRRNLLRNGVVLSPGAAVDDLLQFETVGRVTRRLSRGRRIRLRIAGQTVPVPRRLLNPAR